MGPCSFLSAICDFRVSFRYAVYPPGPVNNETLFSSFVSPNY
jgi:hypothetical protein